MDRRRFLKRSAAAGAGLVVATRLPDRLMARAGEAGGAPFLHGVASGDPLTDRTIIWTRVTPTADATPGSGMGPNVTVKWEVAEDRGFSKVVRSGNVRTGPVVDNTVKVDVGGLHPATEYFYRFRALGAKSATGRTKTAARPDNENPGLRFGVVSCSNYEGGYFSAYRYLAEREDLDLVLHLGDYIYEYAPGGYGPGPEIDRVHQPDHEIVSLADYRIRHALYKSDPDLQALHAQNPFITIWDDHEVANNNYRDGAENHQSEEGDYLERRNDAYRAYFEWMPIRQLSDPYRSFRDFQFGNLVDLHMLDLRQYRDQEASSGQDAAKDDESRTITGDKQMDWLLGGLENQRALWRIIGNQVMFMPWETGPDQPFNVDAWDGYRPDRQQVLQHLVDNEINNVVFLTGDIHSSWAADVPLDPDTYPLASPSVCTELVCTSITSDNLDDIAGAPPRTSSLAVEEGIKATNRHIKEVEFDSHGYSVVDVDRERLQMDWYYISDREDPNATQSFGQAWQVAAGANAVEPAPEPIPTTRR